MFAKNFNPFEPTQLQINLYTAFLANSFNPPQTIKNYLSGARTFLRDKGMDISILASPKHKQTVRGVERRSLHVPRQAPELSIDEIKSISSSMSLMGAPISGERAAFLIMYATFLRKSNVIFSHNSPLHVLRTCDINLMNDILWISIMSSKTITSPADAASLPIYPAPGPHCPIQAWFTHLDHWPRPPTAPAFLTSMGTPISPSSLLTIIRSCLSAINSNNAPSFSFHSMRRTGSRHAARAGASVEDVMTLGDWSSSSVHTYVPRPLFTPAARHISNILASNN